MKRWLGVMVSAFLLLACTACAGQSEGETSDPAHDETSDAPSYDPPQTGQENGQGGEGGTPPQGSEETETMKLTITIGTSTFGATLEQNETARAFAELLPMTIEMTELNGNEKYHYLDGTLPVQSERVQSIAAGDLMLYGSSCVVLFYESFSTSYSYTRLGKLDDAAGLAQALGRENVLVTFALNEAE